MDTTDPIRTAGYFTWLAMLYDRSGPTFEAAIGFSPGSLAQGWKLYTPRVPLVSSNIDLRGSTRCSDGVMPDGRQIRDVIASRSDEAAARGKVANFFDRGLDRRPCKVVPNLRPTAYPSAVGVGLPQFKLRVPVEWVFVLEVAPGMALTRAASAAVR